MQLTECIRLHAPADEARQRARQLLRQVGFSDPGRILKSYPHNLSGGQRQRICIAMAIAGRPKLMIADEPTTALDVTIQAEILKTLKEINRKEGTAILFISHDLGVIRNLCQRVIVMQKGLIVEEGPVDQVFYHPREEYTKRLIASRPTRRKLKGEVRP